MQHGQLSRRVVLSLANVQGRGRRGLPGSQDMIQRGWMIVAVLGLLAQGCSNNRTVPAGNPYSKKLGAPRRSALPELPSPILPSTVAAHEQRRSSPPVLRRLVLPKARFAATRDPGLAASTRRGSNSGFALFDRVG